MFYLEVSLSRDSRIILRGSEETIQMQVTVYDDGQPVEEDKVITITLVRVAGGSSTDTIVTEATLIIHAGMKLVQLTPSDQTIRVNASNDFQF